MPADTPTVADPAAPETDADRHRAIEEAFQRRQAALGERLAAPPTPPDQPAPFAFEVDGMRWQAPTAEALHKLLDSEHGLFLVEGDRSGVDVAATVEALDIDTIHARVGGDHDTVYRTLHAIAAMLREQDANPPGQPDSSLT